MDQACVARQGPQGRKSSSAPPARRDTARPQRENSGRTSRRGMNFPSSEIEELIQTSEMVPVFDHKTVDSKLEQAQDYETSTVAPSSTKTSPALSTMVDDSEASAWPSLREGAMGWDFCSEHSENEDLWEDLPEPMVDLEEFEKEFEKIDISLPKSATSYADQVRGNHGPHVSVQPPSSGVCLRAMTSMQEHRRDRSGSDSAQCHDDHDPMDHLDEGRDMRRHGWTKQQDMSWNKKQQRKVAGQMARRAKQSFQSRGLLSSEE